MTAHVGHDQMTVFTDRFELKKSPRSEALAPSLCRTRFSVSRRGFALSAGRLDNTWSLGNRVASARYSIAHDRKTRVPASRPKAPHSAVLEAPAFGS